MMCVSESYVNYVRCWRSRRTCVQSEWRTTRVRENLNIEWSNANSPQIGRSENDPSWLRGRKGAANANIYANKFLIQIWGCEALPPPRFPSLRNGRNLPLKEKGSKFVIGTDGILFRNCFSINHFRYKLRTGTSGTGGGL